MRSVPRIEGSIAPQGRREVRGLEVLTASSRDHFRSQDSGGDEGDADRTVLARAVQCPTPRSEGRRAQGLATELLARCLSVHRVRLRQLKGSHHSFIGLVFAIVALVVLLKQPRTSGNAPARQTGWPCSRQVPHTIESAVLVGATRSRGVSQRRLHLLVLATLLEQHTKQDRWRTVLATLTPTKIASSLVDSASGGIRLFSSFVVV